MYFQNAGSMIVDVLFGIFIALLIIRAFGFLVSPQNQLYQTILHITNPVLKPFRSFIPGVAGIDIAPLVVAFIVNIAKNYILFFMQNIHGNFPGIALFSLADLLGAILTLAYWALIARIIISWVAPRSYNPAIQLLVQITQPMVSLGQRFIPPIGGIDFSPILIILAINVVQMTAVRYLQDVAIQLLSS